MIRSFFVLLSFICFFSSVHAQPPGGICLPSEEYSFQNYSHPEAWDSTYHHYFKYDAWGQMTLDSIYSYSSMMGDWLPWRVYSYSYDSAGHLLVNEYKEYDVASSTWEKIYRHERRFDSRGNETNYDAFSWNTLSLSWDTTTTIRTTYTYDANASILVMFQELNDRSPNVWEPYQRNTYTRDGIGRALTLINESGPPLTNMARYEWTYPGAGGFDSELFQYWNGISWVNYTRDVNITWNNFTKLQRTYSKTQNWSGSAWNDSLQNEWTWFIHDSYIRHFSDYNGTGWDTIMRVTWYNDSLSKPWYNFIELFSFAAIDTFNADSASYFYNAGECLAEIIYYEWKWAGALRFGGYVRHVYLYNPLAVEEPLPVQNLHVFPNPTADYIWVEWEGEKRDFRIVDISGREQQCFEDLSPGARIDLKSLPSGIYFLYSENIAGAKRIIVTR